MNSLRLTKSKKATARAPKHLTLPDRGILLVSTDLHGNWQDYERLAHRFEQERQDNPQTFWLILGDAVHGPNRHVATHEPELYGFADHSFRIVAAIADLKRRFFRHVLYVLGNHDHGHIGGPHTGKFHADEVKALDSRLNGEQRDLLKDFFLQALLAVSAPCGVLCCHGSPDATLTDLNQLEDIAWAPHQNTPVANAILAGFLRSYGQPGPVTARLLANISRPELDLKVVIHGHDVDDEGWFTEGGNQLCPVLFGAPDHKKRFLRLDLAARYTAVTDFREGTEILNLYP